MSKHLIETGKEIAELQRSIFKLVNKEESPKISKDNPFAMLNGHTKEFLQNRLGNLSTFLLSFANLCNWDHPEIADFIELSSWKDFIEDISSALIDTKNETYLSECKEKLNTKYNSLILKLGALKPRFIKSSEDRNKSRATKNKVANLKPAYFSGKNDYIAGECNLANLIRYGGTYIKEIEKFSRQENVFRTKKLALLGDTISKKIQSLKFMIENEYLGFQRLGPVETAIILAKLHNFKFANNNANNITVPFAHFKPDLFWEDRRGDQDIKNYLEKNSFSYQPRVYPLYEFDDVPENVNKIIKLLESMPEHNNCPIFDYYWLVVPSISVNNKALTDNSNQWKIRIKDTWFTFKDEETCYKAIDRNLVEKEYLFPAVLGERDKNCYFICMWK